MKTISTLGCAVSLLLSTGCTSHLIFAEHSHTGLKVQAGADALSPYEISVGYRRGIVAGVPKINAGGLANFGGQQGKSDPAEKTSDPLTPVDGETEVVTLEYDPNELMSVYSEFCANVGFDDPIQFHHLIVTGNAAVRLLAEADGNSGLRDVLGDIKRCEKTANPVAEKSNQGIGGSSDEQK